VPSPLDATPKSATANSYVTVAKARQIMRRRLYTTTWDAASTTPSADGYQTNGGATLGSTSLAVDAGTGSWTVGTIFHFGSHSQEYTVAAALSAPGTLSFSPGLVQAVLDDDPLLRDTANDQERALMWATQLLEAMMKWDGVKRTSTQALWFPASDIYDESGNAYDYDTIPAILEVATTELANYLLERDVFKVPAALGQGVSEAELGPLKAKIDNTQQIAVIPDNILSLLSTLGVLEPEAQKSSTILPLRRV